MELMMVLVKILRLWRYSDFWTFSVIYETMMQSDDGMVRE